MNIPPRLVLVASLLLSGCYAVVPYAARPGQIRDPEKEALTLLVATASEGCVSAPELNDQILVANVICGGGIQKQVVRLDRITSIVLDTASSSGVYRITVHHSGGAADFVWYAFSPLEDMERLVDALTALSQRSAPAAKKSAPT